MMAELLHTARDGDIALVRINNPPVNALGSRLREQLSNAIDAFVKSDAAALVIGGEGVCFSAGADIREMAEPIRRPDLNEVIARIEGAGKPIVAALHGVVLGGGFELALACPYRIASQGVRLGLPETKLGLIPGSGGTQRLTRLLGPDEALKLMISGDSIGADRAKRLGVIDAIVDGEPTDAAVEFARAVVSKPIPRAGKLNDKLAGGTPDLFQRTRDELLRKKHAHTAPMAIIAAVEAACTLPFAEGLALEQRLYAECRQSPERAALTHLFFAEREIWKVPDIPASTPIRHVARAAVIGAGTMGTGIAMALANAGLDVQLVDAQPQALKRGVDLISSSYRDTMLKGKLTEGEVAVRVGRIAPLSDLNDIVSADIVIEAVFERMDVKLDLFRKIDRVAREGAILATNTSTLDINEIAAVTHRPQDVVGAHFFSPAHVMRLLEIVRGEKTATAVLATVLDLSRRLNKISAVVGVCEGFVGNRMIHPYFREAEFLLAEGATPADVDGALRNFGLPMGPFAMSDMAGNDLRADVERNRALHRPKDHRHSEILQKVAASGRYGHKSGAGWFRYEAGSRAPIPDPEIEPIFREEAQRLGIERRPISAEEIVKRCLYSLVNEGAEILDEGIALRGGDIDVIYVNGYGWPSSRGGPMFWADTIGLSMIVEDLERFRRVQGPHWKIAPLLERLAQDGGSLARYCGSRAHE
jgi:3-hydroxyacyl-CoA dehydrogenase